MRRSLEGYLAVLVILNGVFGWGGIYVSRALRTAYLGLLQADDIPTWTLHALRLWPGFFALAAVALVVGTLAWRRTCTSHVHAAAGIVAVDLGLLVYAFLGSILPFFTLTVKI
jgi:hypothetical protein